MTTLKIAALPPVRSGVCADPDWMAGFGRHVEDWGFESVVVVEHPLVIGDYTSRYPYAPSGRMPLPDDCAIPDPIDLLAFLAGVTTTLGLSTGVLVLPAHHPVVMAKRLATIDRLSKGGCGCASAWAGCARSSKRAGSTSPAGGGGPTSASTCCAPCGPTPSPRGRRSRASSSPSPTRTPIPSPTAPVACPSTSGATAQPRSGAPRAAATGGSPSDCGATSWRTRSAPARSETEAAGRDPDALELTISAMSTQATPETIDKLARPGVDRLVVTCGHAELGAAQDEMAEVVARLGAAHEGRPVR